MRDNSNLPQRRSVRLPGYNYAGHGAYFVTICTENHKCLFGKIAEDKIMLNTIGMIVESCWSKIPSHFSDVELDQFIVMPNHLHGIIFITADKTGTACRAPTDPASRNMRFGCPAAASLPTIIGSFKSAVSRTLNQTVKRTSKSIWQRGYFEHVIRNNESLDKIRKYIIDNPFHWTLDRENPDKVSNLNHPDELSRALW